MNNFSGFQAVIEEMRATTLHTPDELQHQSNALSKAIDELVGCTEAVYKASQLESPDLVFSNSVSYLNMFGHIVIAWLWLRQGIVANQGIEDKPHQTDVDFYNGKLQAMKYFFSAELPQIYLWGNLVKNIDSTNFDTNPNWL